MKKIVVILSLITMLFGCKTVTTFTDTMKKNIDAKNYEIRVANTYPMAGPMVINSAGFSLKIKGDSIYSYLPYYGRAYQIPYGGGKGLNFNQKINKYEQVYTHKGISMIKLTTKNEEDTYKFTITLSPSKSASIYLESNNRQPITYIGDWE